MTSLIRISFARNLQHAVIFQWYGDSKGEPVLNHHTMTVYVEMDIWLLAFFNPDTTYTAMSRQVHAPAALLPGNELLGAFAKWRRATMGLVMSVHMEQPGSHWVNFNEI